MKLKKQQIQSTNITILEIASAYNVLFPMRDVLIKDARFSHELSILRKQIEPIAESYQNELQKLYNEYGTNNGEGKWSIPKEVFPDLNKKIVSLNEAVHVINKVKGITKDYIYEIKDISLTPSFWDAVYDKFFE